MKTHHFESSLGVLLKVSGHVWADTIYMIESIVVLESITYQLQNQLQIYTYKK